QGSGFVPSPDGKRVAFVRGNRAEGQNARHGSDLIVRWLSDGAESTVTHDDVGIRGIVWSPDGNSVAYTAGSKIVHHDESPAYSGAKIIYRAGVRRRFIDRKSTRLSFSHQIISYAVFCLKKNN